jgi:glycosyltransferase involved in cell wall biosynthesis
VLLSNDIATSAGRSARLAQPEPRVLLVHRLSPVRETDRYFPALLDGVSSYAQNVGGRVIVDICGDGPERPQLEEIARNAPPPIDVRFHGAIPQRKLDAFYDRATIFVMPSYREGFPRVILEAMAHGLPIVATDAGGTRDILGPGQQAYVVNRDDPEEFGKAVERLLSSSEDRRRLSDENLATVQRFSTPQIALMYDRALSELIGACPAA